MRPIKYIWDIMSGLVTQLLHYPLLEIGNKTSHPITTSSGLSHTFDFSFAAVWSISIDFKQSNWWVESDLHLTVQSFEIRIPCWSHLLTPFQFELENVGHSFWEKHDMHSESSRFNEPVLEAHKTLIYAWGDTKIVCVARRANAEIVRVHLLCNFLVSIKSLNLIRVWLTSHEQHLRSTLFWSSWWVIANVISEEKVWLSWHHQSSDSFPANVFTGDN